MKWLRIIIISIIVIGAIFSIIAYRNYHRNYQEKIYREQRDLEFQQIEEKRKADIELRRDERYSKYKLIENIGQEYFEKGLTTIEIENRKKQVINEISGKTYDLYVKLRDIKMEGSHRVALFSSNSVFHGYDVPVSTVFYDDNKLLDNIKTGTLLDIEAKAIRAIQLNGNNRVTIYFNIISVNITDDTLWGVNIDRRISEKDWR